MPLNISSPRADARLVHLRRNDLEQVERVVDARRRVRLDLLRRPVVRHTNRAQAAPSSDRPRASRLDVLLRRGSLLRARLRRSLRLRRRTGLLLREQPRVLGLARELRLAFLLLVLLRLAAALRSLGPLLCLLALLRTSVAQRSAKGSAQGKDEGERETAYPLCLRCGGLLGLVLSLLGPAGLLLCVSSLRRHV